MQPLVLSSGEPAGIGPDIVLQAAENKPCVVLADVDLLKARAFILGLPLTFIEYQGGDVSAKKNTVYVLHHALTAKVTPGILNTANVPYVLTLIQRAVKGCLKGEFSAMVTAPIHKGIINQANVPFKGHTEYLAELANVKQVVMMLACKKMRVALASTHLPLKAVPKAITKKNLLGTLTLLQQALKQMWGIINPQIYVAGLNPHAGEGGYLGQEEIDIIAPAIKAMKNDSIFGPLPADTLFTPPFLQKADAFLAMYHDQGLTVLKYAGFGCAMNITLGLPFIRTSVDHGTALSLAATGKASFTSLQYAINEALTLGARQCVLV